MNNLIVIGPGFESADSILVLAIVLLGFAFIELLYMRSRLTEEAEQWRRFSSWFPTSAARFDTNYQDCHPMTIAVDLLRRCQRARNDGQSLHPALKRAAASKLACEFYECVHCHQPIKRVLGVWVHTGGAKVCPALAMPAEVQ